MINGKYLIGKAKSFVVCLLSILSFLQERRIKRNDDKIRVGFICQYIPAWNKLLPIYEKLENDSRFEVFLICVPNTIENGEMIDPNDLKNETYDYFVSQKYHAINALVGKDKWYDLKQLSLDYLFFSRPYDGYMPKPYWSNRVCKFTKICSVLYAINMTKETRDVVLNKYFYRNVYCYFAETLTTKEHNINRFKLTHRLGLQKTLFYGMPALEQMAKPNNAKSPAWDFSNNEFRVLWTPRWTTDLKLGGTNFFTYYLWFLEYAKKRENFDFLLRPHPMAFSNFIKKGLMSENEVAKYKEEINKLSNVKLDLEKEYDVTFWNSSVLVSDTSSVVAEYFVTGKPLVFCASNMILEPEEHTKKILEGCYVVNNAAELEKCLDMLAHGEDYLKEKRKKIIEEVFGDTLYTSTDNIVKELLRK